LETSKSRRLVSGLQVLNAWEMLIIKTCTEVRPDEGRPSYQREQGMVLWKSCISLLVEEVLLGTTQIMLQCRDGKFVFTP